MTGAAVSDERSEAQGWRLSVTLSRIDFEALEEALANHADAVVAETVTAAHPARDAPSDSLRVTLFGSIPPADDPRTERLLALLRAAGAVLDGATVEPVPAADWAAQSSTSFPPIPVGRFTIVDGHRAPQHGRFVLSISAGPAFGSGRHETTQGCLLALDRLARRRRVRRAFDVGTGSGILAVAAARLWPARVLALDNDPTAVAAARETVQRNALSKRVSVVQSTGFRARSGTRLGRADLICANIRAKPIAAMAPDFARHLSPGGAVVVSGLLATEEPLVLAAFRNVRLRLRQRIRLGAWATLILTR